MTNIGMMEGAYFVGSMELLNWLNDLLKLDYTKVEQTCSAAAHCQIMDAIYPGKVSLSKVNFTAKNEYEYVANFKILQTVFDKLGIDKHIDVTKLVKGKYQDNLEFFQWIKRYFDLNYSGGEYNAVERRNQVHKGTGTAVKKVIAPVKKTEPMKKAALIPTARVSVGGTKEAPTKTTATKPKATEPKEPKEAKPITPADDKNPKVQELTQTVAELKVTIDALEKERDFYFGKLREIEIFCQSSEDQTTELLQKIFGVLYATDEAEGFVAEPEAEPEEAPPVEEEEHIVAEEEIESF